MNDPGRSLGIKDVLECGFDAGETEDQDLVVLGDEAPRLVARGDLARRECDELAVPDTGRFAGIVIGFAEAGGIQLQHLLGVVVDGAGGPAVGGIVDQVGDDWEDVLGAEAEARLCDAIAFLTGLVTVLLAEHGGIGKRLLGQAPAFDLGVACAVVGLLLVGARRAADDVAQALQPRPLFGRDAHARCSFVGRVSRWLWPTA